MKTLASASAEPDFRGNGRDVNTVEDYWTSDVAGLYALAPTAHRREIHTETDHQTLKLIDLSVAGAEYSKHTFELRWTRWDAAAPDVQGLEMLTLILDDPSDGRSYMLPGPSAKALYTMATPAKGEGATAVELYGIVRVEKHTSSGALLDIDVAARMARTDVRGEFPESVRGTYWLPARGD